MDGCVWGPPLWSLVHGAAMSADSGAEETVRSIIETMECVLPCKHCRASLSRFRPVIQTLCFATPFEMTWLLHNSVNRKLGKPEMTFERAHRVWSNCSSEPVSAMQLAEALVVVDANLANRAHWYRDAKLVRCYRRWWSEVAALCDHIPLLASTGRLMREVGPQISRRSLLRRSNCLRSKLLEMGGRKDLALHPRQAACRARRCQKTDRRAVRASRASRTSRPR